MDYEIVLRCEPRQDTRFVVVGLPDADPLTGAPEADTELTLVGMYHSLDTPESIYDAVHRALYDHYQVTESLRKGDTLHMAPCQFVHSPWRKGERSVPVPEMRFRVEGVHVLREGE